MKWLILFPAWVFLISYLIYRIKEANRELAEPVPMVGESHPAVIARVLDDAPEPRRTRASTTTGVAIRREAVEFRDRVQLLPLAAPAYELGGGVSPLWPSEGYGEEEFRLASRSEFDTWRLFDSEDLSFYIPDEEGFSVEALGGSPTPPMVGEIFFQSDVEPERWYRVVGPGGVTWCAFAVDHATKFDDDERYPSPEIFHKFLLAGSGVVQASSGEEGRVRRVQWLGRGVRVSLLDWQHGAAHHAAYVAIAASLELGHESRKDRVELSELVGGAGLETRIGLLERGMSESRVEAVLGRPAGISGSTWLYHVPDRAGDRYYRITFENGAFRGMGLDWRTVRKDPPISGSMEWMLEKTELRAGDAGGVGYNLGALTDEEVDSIFSAVRLQLSSAGVEQWSDFCKILANMAEMRLKDEGVLEQLRARFLEPGLPPGSALLVLRVWDPDNSRSLFVKKSMDILGDLRWKAANPSGGRQWSDDLRMLISYIGETHPASAQLVSKAAAHPHPQVRSVGYSFWSWLGEGERDRLLRSGLGDASVDVRRRCAEAFASGLAQPGDRGMLEDRLAGEADAEAREHLARALERLPEGKAGG